jgi:hypothetical protein
MPSINRRRAPPPDVPMNILADIAKGGADFVSRLETIRSAQQDADDALAAVRIAEAELSAGRSALIEAKAAYQRDADAREAALAEREAVVVEAEHVAADRAAALDRQRLDLDARGIGLDDREANLRRREDQTVEAITRVMTEALERYRHDR